MTIKKISLLISLLMTASCAYTMKVTVPKKVAAPQKKQTQLISPKLSDDVALMIKKLIQEQTPARKLAVTPVTVTKKPAESIKSVANKAVVAAKSVKKSK